MTRFSRTAKMTKRARALRNKETPAEKRLWYHLRRKQVANCHFRRQHPVGPYVLDFYCAAIKLAVELDGGVHKLAANQLHNAIRTEWLKKHGISIVRFTNDDVFRDPHGVLYKVSQMASAKLNRTKCGSAAS